VWPPPTPTTTMEIVMRSTWNGRFQIVCLDVFRLRFVACFIFSLFRRPWGLSKAPSLAALWTADDQGRDRNVDVQVGIDGATVSDRTTWLYHCGP